MSLAKLGSRHHKTCSPITHKGTEEWTLDSGQGLEGTAGLTLDMVVMGQPDSAGQKDEQLTGLSWGSRTARDRRLNNGQGCHGTDGQRGTEE